MAKPRGVEAKLTRLYALRNAPMSADAIAVLSQALGDASNVVVAEAAALVGTHTVKVLAPDLVAAFARLMIEPEESDKQCRGKIALVEALNKVEYAEPEVFLRGLTHVQDPHRGEPGDAAGPLRAHSAIGLARIGHPGLILLLVDRLFDRDKAARTGVVRAIAGTVSLAAVPLLRYKALSGDMEEAVMGECFASLLSLAPDESLAFVARFLGHRAESVQSEAVLALAETRRPAAFTLLQSFWPQAPDNVKESVLLGMAMFRIPAALDFLIDLIAQKNASARGAVSALAIHRHNDKIRDSVAVAVQANGDPDLQLWFKKKFPEVATQPGQPPADDAHQGE